MLEGDIFCKVSLFNNQVYNVSLLKINLFVTSFFFIYFFWSSLSVEKSLWLCSSDCLCTAEQSWSFFRMHSRTTWIVSFSHQVLLTMWSKCDASAWTSRVPVNSRPQTAFLSSNVDSSLSSAFHFCNWDSWLFVSASLLIFLILLFFPEHFNKESKCNHEVCSLLSFY